MHTQRFEEMVITVRKLQVLSTLLTLAQQQDETPPSSGAPEQVSSVYLISSVFRTLIVSQPCIAFNAEPGSTDAEAKKENEEQQVRQIYSPGNFFLTVAEC